jgi:hypothetical protein
MKQYKPFEAQPEARSEDNHRSVGELHSLVAAQVSDTTKVQ